MTILLTKTIKGVDGTEVMVNVIFDELTKCGEITIDLPDCNDTGIMTTHRLPFRLPEN